MKIGLISDTHGYLSPAVWTLFEGCSAILHAGDVGNATVLADLETIAPVQAVKGNTDAELWRLPETIRTEIGQLNVFIQHIAPTVEEKGLKALARNVGPGIAMFGHTHRPFVKQIRQTVFVNPGSASRGKTGYNTAGVLTANDSNFSIAVHNLSDKKLEPVLSWPDKAKNSIDMPILPTSP